MQPAARPSDARMPGGRLAPYATIGLAVAAAVLIADQLVKYFVLSVIGLELGQRIVVTPFFDLVLVHNRGISYGLFQLESDVGRWFLTAIKVGAAVLFALWLIRTHSRIAALSLGLLIGGALGNALDRVLHGAVIDFVSLHALGWRWYVFNLADAAIVAGVFGLLYDAFRGDVTKSPP